MISKIFLNLKFPLVNDQFEIVVKCLLYCLMLIEIGTSLDLEIGFPSEVRSQTCQISKAFCKSI